MNRVREKDRAKTVYGKTYVWCAADEAVYPLIPAIVLADCGRADVELGCKEQVCPVDDRLVHLRGNTLVKKDQYLRESR